MKDKDSKEKRSELRQRAELAAAEKSLGISDVSALSPEKVQQLIHELQVHQIELEMQNEELRQAQIKLGELKDRYLDLYDFAPVGYVTLSDKGLILEANLTAVRLLGVERQSLIKTFFSRLVSPEFGDAYYLHLQQVFETQSKQTCEIKLARKDGTHFHAQLESVAVQDEDGEYSRCRTIVMDASERKRAEGVQRESDERNRFLAGVIENSSQPFGTGYPDGRVGIVNRAFCDLTGYSEEELRLIDWNVTLTPPEWIESEMQHLTELERTGKPVRYEKEYIRKDGSRVPIELLVHVVRGETGEPLHYQAFLTDLTERKRAEEMLLRARKDWEDIFQAIGHVTLILDLEGTILSANRSATKALGKSEEEVIGKKCYELFHRSDHHPDGCPLAKLRLDGEFKIEEMEVEALGGYYLVTCTPLVEESGSVQRVIHIATDITERKRAVEALEESEQQYRTLFEESIDGVYSVLRDGEITDANASFCELFGYTREEMIGKNILDLYLDPADRPKFQKEIEQKGFVKDYQVEFRKRDGKEIDCLLTSSVHFGKDGSIAGYRGILRDLTARKLIQGQLQQAQKMKAVGTLAGGIAHDFNNLLQVVLGYSELALADEDLPHHLRDDLGRVILAARNGADLVQRLLTFSRKTETKSLDLDLNQRIRQTQKFLQRTIPKMIDIELVLADDLADIHADPTQVDQVLMNLAVNARDAMPEGGKLIIETANILIDEEYARSQLEAKPGRYVLLRVSDNGSGMNKETLGHIFEPFYTTKGLGQGTGLGLAMVFGIVKQHHGFINCYSEVGHGTTFKVYLPAAIPATRSELPVVTAIPQGGTETILLVDDEELIRDLGKRFLRKAGYTVLTACNGKEALELYRSNKGSTSLVILDLIMPEMDGKQCLRELLKINPGAIVLVASGYSASGPTKEALEGGAKGFVSKPFDMEQLLQTVRKVMDET